jgi:DNA-binding CsgD family transcriptional regulator
MTEDEVIERFEAKFDSMIKLLAMLLTSEEQTVREKAILLSRAGLSAKDIAALCDTTPNTISVALSNAKKEKKR